MAIEPLSPAVSRLIGSAQKLADPESVVKELIENSLDAHATKISVEVSANTTDCIVVKDDGCGIHPGDRELACKRFCTSKLREYADLELIGGQCLGFRGEALSNIAEISGSMHIITRINRERIAQYLQISRDGLVTSRSATSHPVGTTVRASDLFKNIPVRLQYCRASASKCLNRLYKLMRSYALLRVSVRFSLRILGSKSTNSNFTYAPGPSSCSMDAVRQIFGNACASQYGHINEEQFGFKIEALLPRPDAKSSSISGIGPFVSVDGRIISPRKGVLKQVVKLVSNRITAIISDAKDPLILLNLVCPPGSYDPNVDCSKDQIVFQDSSQVIMAVEDILRAQYPQKPFESSKTNPRAECSSTLSEEPRPVSRSTSNISSSTLTEFIALEAAANEKQERLDKEKVIDRRRDSHLDHTLVGRGDRKAQSARGDRNKKIVTDRSGAQDALVNKTRGATDHWLPSEPISLNVLEPNPRCQGTSVAECSRKSNLTVRPESYCTYRGAETSRSPFSPRLSCYINQDEEEYGKFTQNNEFTAIGSSFAGTEAITSGDESFSNLREESDSVTPGETKLPRMSKAIEAAHETRGRDPLGSREISLVGRSNTPVHGYNNRRLKEARKIQTLKNRSADIRSYLLRSFGDVKYTQASVPADAVTSRLEAGQYDCSPPTINNQLNDDNDLSKCRKTTAQLLQPRNQLLGAMLEYATSIHKGLVFSDYLPYPNRFSKLLEIYHIFVDGRVLRNPSLRNKILKLQRNSSLPG